MALLTLKSQSQFFQHKRLNCRYHVYDQTKLVVCELKIWCVGKRVIKILPAFKFVLATNNKSCNVSSRCDQINSLTER